MSSLDYLDLCRLCLVKDRVSVPIFEDEGDVRQIFLKITACLPVKVGRDDKLPKKICDDCVYKVELFYQFWNTTANAEKQLLQWLGEVGGLEEKQGYVTDILNQNVMKQERNSENRLEGSLMQVSGHPNNMDINMMDENMTLSIPMMIPTGNQQISVPMDSVGNTVQAVPGPSTQASLDQVSQSQVAVSSRQDEEDETSDEDDNTDDDCDNEGLPVKEESEDDPNSSRNLEPATFVNVSLCDEAGPSGLQQQKISEMSEIAIPQTSDGDPKTESDRAGDEGRGIFIYQKESVVMRMWQILEFDGKPYYTFVPEHDTPMDECMIPEQIDNIEIEELNKICKLHLSEVNCLYKNKGLVHDFISLRDCFRSDQCTQEVEAIKNNTKSSIFNGIIDTTDEEKVTNVENPYGDLYQVKVESGVVTLEQVDVSALHPDQLECIEDELVNEDMDLVETVATQGGHNEGLDIRRDESEDNGHQFMRKNASVNSPRLLTSERIPKLALKCKACEATFSSSIAFRKHVAWTHKKKVCIQENGAYICAVCDFRTLKKSVFATHLQRKHDTWTHKKSSNLLFPCNACGFICRSKHSLQSHFIRKHTDRYEHQCKFCPKKFKVKGDLTNHIRFHHKEKPLNCDVCGKLCLNSGSLYVHQKWAHYKPKFECHICKRRMVTQENLDQHMLTQHERREKIVCAECGKTFTKKDSFKRHMAVHTGSKPHTCLICNKPFARRSQLRQHLLIHTGKRPFICDICGKAFTQKPGLICHRKTHPGSHPPLPVMPIGEIVKEFTDGYFAENAQEVSDPNDLAGSELELDGSELDSQLHEEFEQDLDHDLDPDLQEEIEFEETVGDKSKSC